MRADKIMLKVTAKAYDRSQKGYALAEFALILPLFLTLVFGMIFYSLALYNKIILTMAVREGARAGAISANTSAAIDAADDFNDELISLGSPSTPTFTPAINSGTKIVTVTAAYNYPKFYVFPAISLSAETTMRLE